MKPPGAGGENRDLFLRVADSANGNEFFINQASAVSGSDLVTTSARAGHAAAVGDVARAPGAVLGKAMTGLDAGQGLVLVSIQ